MKSPRPALLLIVALALPGMLAACSASDEVGAEGAVGADSWAARGVREADYTQFWKDNAEDLHSFRDVPVGITGIPVIMFRLFPDIMPDLWGNYLQEVGLFAAPQVAAEAAGVDHAFLATPRRTYGLPYGIGWVDQKLGAGAVSAPILSMVHITCAACHTGRVRDDSGTVRYLLGAPSQTFSAAAYSFLFTKTVRDTRFVVSEFSRALDTKKAGWLYPGDRAREVRDTAVLKAMMSPLLKMVKDGIETGEESRQRLIGDHTYNRSWSHSTGGDVHDLLNGGTPGQVEAFGTLVANLIPQPVQQLPEGEEKEALLRAYLPPKPASTDIMSVWGQGKRPAAQWDGSIANPLLRNLGAEFGVLGSAALVNFENGVATTRLLERMPPPVYPFAIDGSRLARGEKVYRAVCATCHDASPGKGYDVGTDPNRALGLTERSRQALTDALNATCPQEKRATIPLCKTPSADAVTTPRSYLAAPLDGIWARAPYFHNGSVPTLAQVLQPSKRVSTFVRGNIGYDKNGVGFDWKTAGPYTTVYDTKREGLSNAGHANYLGENGKFVDFEKDAEARAALLEYLKTL
jgi:mono/diheme cytochrome c family protein